MKNKLSVIVFFIILTGILVKLNFDTNKVSKSYNEIITSDSNITNELTVKSFSYSDILKYLYNYKEFKIKNFKIDQDKFSVDLIYNGDFDNLIHTISKIKPATNFSSINNIIFSENEAVYINLEFEK